jgi:formylglycine-generating enzyme required for sulfatase activity
MQRVRSLVKISHETDALPRNLALSLTNDIELELVLVRSGEFLMGSPETEERHSDNESLQHAVGFASPFYIGRFPVTQAQWQAVTGNNPSQHRGDPDLPVDRVSWINCQKFCDLLCSRLKRVFRLPTEAEWEYACRAGTTTAVAFGAKLPPDSANFIPYDQYMANSVSESKRNTTPVGSFAPNAWGIYDNVPAAVIVLKQLEWNGIRHRCQKWAKRPTF